MQRHPAVNHIESVSQLMRTMGLPPPLHPLIALVNYDKTKMKQLQKGQVISLGFYKISFKNQFNGQAKYGQGYYDFEDGGLAFLSPRQMVTAPEDLKSNEGYALYFHADFIQHFPLGRSIHQYGFFSYDVAEALFLSLKEKEIIENLFRNMEVELQNNIDAYSQNILVSQIELLLNYSDRFYNRQFLTRKVVNHQIISSLDLLLKEYFDNSTRPNNGLPSVQFISSGLKLSQRYLSDMLRSLTGLNTQQYIQNTVINNAKDKLATTSLSISEIAYELGFSHSQSFSKVFKNKTNQSPSEYRASFNKA